LGEPSALALELGYAELNDAVLALNVKANKSALNSAIALAQAILAAPANYVPSTLTGLAAELANAQGVAADQNATAAGVESARQALLAKVSAVKLVAAMGPLSASASIASTLVAGSFTPDSYARLAAALKVADAVLANPAATQAEADAAFAELEAARAALVSESSKPIPAQASQAAGGPAASAAAPATGKVVTAKVAKVAVTGKAKVGSKLKAKLSGKTPGAKVSYTWYRGAKKVASAKSATYKVSKADKGKKIRVKVRIAKSGFKTSFKVSTARKVV
jgi:hypothetical protein